MNVFQMPRFKKYVKKLPHHFQQVILDAVECVIANPLTLMAYKVENDSIFLYQVGPHENFYKNLKKYLKEIGE
jgi:mRNA-degrading endonuclease RelE of RelBE toxin-antitoxin system